MVSAALLLHRYQVDKFLLCPKTQHPHKGISIESGDLLTESTVQELQGALDVLKYKTWLYEVALEAGTTAVHDHMPLEDMPANIRKIKERIRRLTDDMEQFYKEAAKE